MGMYNEKDHKISDLEREIENIKQQNRQFETKIREYEKISNDKTKEIDRLKKDNEKLSLENRQNKTKKAEINKKTKEIDRLKKENEKLSLENRQIKIKTTEINEKNKEIDRLKQENEKLRLENSQISAKITEINEKNKEIDRLKQENEKFSLENRQIKTKTTEINEKNKEIDRLNQDNENLRLENRQISTKIAEINEKNKEIDRLNQENEKLCLENSQISTKITEINAKNKEINQLKKDNENKLQKEINQLETKVKEYKKIINEKKNDINELQQENETLIEKTRQNKLKMKEYKDLEKDNEQLDEENNLLKKYLFELKEKLKNIEFVSFNDYEEGQVIGGGNTSTVKIVYKKEEYAKKELTEFTHKTLKRFIQEGELLFKLRHPCIIRIHGFFLGDRQHAPFMILSLESKSLENSIDKNELNEEQKNRIIVELVLGMRYIHRHRFIHRSLKPSNILLSKNNHVRISDFGLAKEEDMDTSISKGPKNLVFMAPELFDEEEDEDDEGGIKYTNKVDVYSFGMILIYIINEAYPKFRLKRVKSGSIPSLPDTIPSWVQELISRCLSFSPKKRPTFAEIFKILKDNNYDLFRDEDEDDKKPKKKIFKMKKRIESRISKIEGFEFQHQDLDDE